jgi:hypothetical protein
VQGRIDQLGAGVGFGEGHQPYASGAKKQIGFGGRSFFRVISVMDAVPDGVVAIRT